jgi:pSer/pThr/pTyr-binding forkhead associated (FHA) protein
MITRIVFHGMTKEHHLAFEQESITIGKHPTNDVGCFDYSTQMSRHHAVLNWDEGAWWVRDLGTLHGTFVNGKRVAKDNPVRVNSGDRILAGGQEIELLYETR